MNDEMKVSELASLLASLTAGVAGLAFLVSMVFDIGYFKELGYPMSELPTTLSDHVRSSMNWVSWILVSISFTLFMELLTGKIEGGRSEEEIVSESPNPRKTYLFRRSPYYFILAICIMVVVLYKIFGGLFKIGLPLSSFIVWGSFASWAQSPRRIQERRSKALRMTIIILPAIGFLAYTSGQLVADYDMLTEEPTSRLHLASGEVQEVKVLRSMDKRFLIHHPKSPNVEFVSLGTVSKVERPHADIDLLDMFEKAPAPQTDNATSSSDSDPAPDKPTSP